MSKVAVSEPSRSAEKPAVNNRYVPMMQAALQTPARDQRRGVFRETLRRFRKELPNCRNEEAIVTLLLQVGRWYGITSVRFHRLTADGHEMVSIAGAGHSDAVAAQLRTGLIRKSKDVCRLDSTDSFQCFKYRAPVLFKVVPSLSKELQYVGDLKQLPFFELKQSQCVGVLGNNIGPVHVDIPLIYGDKAIGKLSCGFATRRVTDSLASRVKRFHAHLDTLPGHLQTLVQPVVQLWKDRAETMQWTVNSVDNLERFYQLCADSILRKLNTTHASLYTHHTDDLHSDSQNTSRLILRYSTDPIMQGLINGGADGDRRGFFNVASTVDESLAAWVARRRKPLRLPKLNDAEMLKALFKSIDPELIRVFARAMWLPMQGYRSYLAVPMTVNNRLIGVLELTNKAEGRQDAFYTHNEEDWLCAVTCDHLAPRLKSLLDQERNRLISPENKKFQKCFKAVTEILHESRRSGLTDVSGLAIATRNLELIARITRSSHPARHTCILDRVEPHRNRVSYITHADSHKADSCYKFPVESEYKGSLAERLEKKSILYIHDLSREMLARTGWPRETMSAVACALPFGNSNGRGTLTVLSNRFDLTPETHVPLLRHVVWIAGQSAFCSLKR